MNLIVAETMTRPVGGRPPMMRGAPDRPVGPGLGRRVAIVEDELMVAWSLESLVEELGHDVTGIHARGEAAVAAIGADADIVLMDINLGGGMDGIETARRLREAGEFTIIFISAYGDAATRARIAEQVPGARLLRKPVSAAQLSEALKGIGVSRQ